jgi:hypothetical protein
MQNWKEMPERQLEVDSTKAYIANYDPQNDTQKSGLILKSYENIFMEALDLTVSNP